MDSMKTALSALDSIIKNAEDALQGVHSANGLADETCAAVKKPKPQKKKKVKQPAQPAPPPSVSQFLQLDLRVGKIIHVSLHPESEKLFALKLKYGDDEAERSVCAGLVGFVAADELQDRLVVTIANLKPRTLRGVLSEAMILAGSVRSSEDDSGAASVKEKVAPLDVPADAASGDIVSFEGLNGERTVTTGKFVSSKNWDRCVGRLCVRNGQAMYDNKPLIVSSKPVTCALPDGAEIH